MGSKYGQKEDKGTPSKFAHNNKNYKLKNILNYKLLL